MILLSIVLLLLLSLFTLSFSVLFIAKFMTLFTTDAPYISISEAKQAIIVNNFNLKSGDIFFDLGCGSGNILSKVSSQYPGIKVYGVDSDFIAFYIAKFMTRNDPGVVLIRQNIFKTYISSATHIYVYLFPQVMEKVWKKVRRECKPGTKIFSCDFPIPNIEPTRVIDLTTNTERETLGQKLFEYTV